MLHCYKPRSRRKVVVKIVIIQLRSRTMSVAFSRASKWPLEWIESSEARDIRGEPIRKEFKTLTDLLRSGSTSQTDAPLLGSRHIKRKIYRIGTSSKCSDY